MKIKRAFSILISALMLISLCSCGDGDSSDTVKESSTLAIAEESESYTEEITDTTENTDNTQVSASVVSEIFDDPADWSKEQIVEIYKAAAEKSNATAVSDQKITLTSISVNNGQYEGLFDFITPIMSKLLANNSKQKDGITGGFRNLTVSDVKPMTNIIILTAASQTTVFDNFSGCFPFQSSSGKIAGKMFSGLL